MGKWEGRVKYTGSSALSDKEEASSLFCEFPAKNQEPASPLVGRALVTTTSEICLRPAKVE
jgi:hypothetical protein